MKIQMVAPREIRSSLRRAAEFTSRTDLAPNREYRLAAAEKYHFNLGTTDRQRPRTDDTALVKVEIKARKNKSYFYIKKNLQTLSHDKKRLGDQLPTTAQLITRIASWQLQKMCRL